MKKLGFGMMRLPLTDPNIQGQVDLEQVCAMVDTFLERGFTYFDTAYMYHDHNSERVVRKALVERHPRESFTLATKLPLSMMKDSTPADQERIFNEQLEKCGVAYFDYYLLHNLIRRPMPEPSSWAVLPFCRRRKRLAWCGTPASLSTIPPICWTRSSPPTRRWSLSNCKSTIWIGTARTSSPAGAMKPQ